MSIFGKIKEAIFGHKTEAAPVQAAPVQTGRVGEPTANPGPASAQPAAQPAASPAAMPQMGTPAAAAQAPVDVDAVLADLARKNGQALNYQSSIVDLMKLLGLESSLDNRKQLATELGYAGAKDGSAEMNVWLHKAVMRELEKNGGKVSAALKE